MQIETSGLLTELLDLPRLFSNTLNIALLVIVFLVTLGSDKLKAWLEKNTNRKLVRSVDKNSRVNSLLSEVRVLYDADRVLLYQLHNGQYYFSGEGADKLSLTNFVLKTGVAVPTEIPSRHTNILISHWANTFSKMGELGTSHMTIDELKDPSYQQIMSVDGVISVVTSPVKDRQGMWKGIIILCYMDECTDVRLEEIKKYSIMIGDLLKA